MFRCVAKIQGLIIDSDSFDDAEIEEFDSIAKAYRCLFISSDDNAADGITALYGTECVYRMEKYVKAFAPNSNTHGESLNRLNLKTTQIAYVSKNLVFLNRAMGFLCGSILISDAISYNGISRSPDLICADIGMLKAALELNVCGYLGEVYLFPEKGAKGRIIPVEFPIDSEKIGLYIIGRYFGHSHYMSQFHPYSSAIYLNKKEGKIYGKFNDSFARLYISAIKRMKDGCDIDGIFAVPPRPSSSNRFDDILNIISDIIKIENLSDHLICTSDYPSQKGLSSVEREENVKDIFRCKIELSGKTVVLIDDIITTGATMRACVRELKRKGAKEVLCVVLAVNQLSCNYWSSMEPQVLCPKCGEPMHLNVNSSTLGYFYSCYKCSKTIGFKEGRELLIHHVDEEFTDGD